VPFYFPKLIQINYDLMFHLFHLLNEQNSHKATYIAVNHVINKRTLTCAKFATDLINIFKKLHETVKQRDLSLGLPCIL